ncbi:transcriptional regulator [Asticcacaulis endophyticus]|uniref:Regulatory protein FlaEY n=1 Tax=Asticcacaulis endophyticus TaxID=1395890 RepID=A0A918QC78_9CAUL|nr:transcriptional regulator [Asticcacaulis endophyticus]GGZ39477.1 regulatory protein FlaEY [Asticcacaulis endophyticus]
MIGLDASFLQSYYNAKAGVNSGVSSLTNASTATNSPTGTTKAPSAPWETKSGAASSDELVRKVMAGSKFIKEGNVSLDLAGASQDYKKLFTLYQGLNTLMGIANKAQENTTTSTVMRTLQRLFTSGMSEIQDYVSDAELDHVSLVQGALTEKLKSTTGVARTDTTYVAKDIHKGSATSSVKAFEGDVKFNIAINPPSAGLYTPKNVEIDLSEMGTTNRSMGNVVNFINSKLKDAGATTRFTVERTPAKAETIKVGEKEVTVNKGLDTFSLKVQGTTTELIKFSAAQMSDSVYVVQTTGDTDNDDKDKPETLDDLSTQLVKFQADISGTNPSTATAGVTDTYWSEGRTGQAVLEENITNVRQTVSGADGSVYVLADVDGEVDGQGIKGTKDVALIKYDSAGKMLYTRTLGAADQASGLAMTVSADGKVAIAGSVTGELGVQTTKTFTSADGKTYTTSTYETTKGYNESISDSFVTVFDAAGDELWTQRRGSIGMDEALSVSFGTDGSVYVGGRAQGTMSGATDGAATAQGVTSAGGWDAYVMKFSATGGYQSTTQFGTSATDAANAMTVDGNTLYVAANENGNAVLRSYDLTSGKPVLSETRDLGNLGGGSISSVSVYDGKVYLGGSANQSTTATGANTKLMDGVSAGHAYTGGQDAFALSVSKDLGDTSADAVSFYGSSESEANAKVTFSDGKAWIAFQTKGAVDGTTKIGEKDAVLARVDVESGDVEWQTRYTGKNGEVNPNAIAISKNSSSVLDKLGLPTGTLQYKDSSSLVANTTARPGDEFYVRDPKTGTKKKIVIEAKDTLETLATKINRAAGYKMDVKVTKVTGKPESILTITPKFGNAEIEIVRGTEGKDALDSLGLSEGLVTNAASQTSSEASKQSGKDVKMFGLNLDSNLNISDEDTIDAVKKVLEDAMKNVRSAYRYLRYGDSSEEADKKGKTGGTVPAYLTKQLANYQDALNRLSGG